MSLSISFILSSVVPLILHCGVSITGMLIKYPQFNNAFPPLQIVVSFGSTEIPTPENSNSDSTEKNNPSMYMNMCFNYIHELQYMQFKVMV